MNRAAREPAPALHRGREIVELESRQAWRDWLEAHHRSSPGVWFVYWKSASDRRGVDYDAAVEEALCFGWIDSLTKTLDADRRIQLMTPRKPKSIWSRSNKERVARLTATGLMRPAGLAAVERAKANGSWTQADAAENLEAPPDLLAALDAEPAARSAWDRFPPSVRRGLIWWVISAKRPETRARRVVTIVDEALAGRRAGG